MGERENESLKIFKQSLPRIKDKFKPEKVYLFGSQARGEALECSDLDVVIISEGFRNIKFLNRITEVLEIIDPPVGIDLLCYTPEEFARKREEIGIVQESLKCMIEL
jgi:predicted nucleotidyltransferase